MHDSIVRIARWSLSPLRLSPALQSGTAEGLLRSIGVIFVFIVVVGGCAWVETDETSYETYDDAVADGALEDGWWLPEFLPRSARSIIDRHNIDTNEIWVRFGFSKADIAHMAMFCEEIRRDEVVYPWPRSTRRVRWWPKDLRRESPAPEGHYTYYRCPRTSGYRKLHKPHFAFLAVSKDSSVAWYWGLSS
jgi:hypothetical protein